MGMTPPQIPITGLLGAGGNFPTLHAGTIVMGNGDYTMVYPDMSANVLIVTSSGALTATRSIIAPLTQGFQFVIQNATSGGQSIIIRGATGTGVEIPNGQAMTVISDGTNYVSAGGVDLSSEVADLITNVSTLNGDLSTLTTRVTTVEGNRVLRSGDSMSGLLLLSGDPTGNLGAATKQYVDATPRPTHTMNVLAGNGAGGFADTGVATPGPGILDALQLDSQVGNIAVVNLAADPTGPLQATTKQYVDAVGTRTTALEDTRVLRAGDTMTGRLTISAGGADITGNTSLMLGGTGNTFSLNTHLIATQSANGTDFVLNPNNNSNCSLSIVGAASGWMRGTFSQGFNCSATGLSSHAQGHSSNAQGVSSHAENHAAVATADFSHCEGSMCQTQGQYSHAEGRMGRTTGLYSHVEGSECSAVGLYSHAEGELSTATGRGSHAEGFRGSNAVGDYSHVWGAGNLADGWAETVCGRFAQRSNANPTWAQLTAPPDASYYDMPALTIGNGYELVDAGPPETFTQSRSNCFQVMYSGDVTIARHTFINGSIGQGSNAQPWGSESSAFNGSFTSGWRAFSSGHLTQANGQYSHAEGFLSFANGDGSHAEGQECNAIGISSHAEGRGSITNGMYSHASGEWSRADGYCETVVGRLNLESGASPTVALPTSNISPNPLAPAFTVGSGYQWLDGVDPNPQTVRRNAFQVNNSGDAWIVRHGNVGGNLSTSWTTNSRNINAGGTANFVGQWSISAGNANTVGRGALSVGSNCNAANESFCQGVDSIAAVGMSHASGWRAWAMGYVSDAKNRGTTANGYASSAGGWGTVANGVVETVIGLANVPSGGISDFPVTVVGTPPNEQEIRDIPAIYAGNNNLFVIGNGTAASYMIDNTIVDQQSNALVCDVWGNLQANRLTIGGVNTGVPTGITAQRTTMVMGPTPNVTGYPIGNRTLTIGDGTTSAAGANSVAIGPGCVAVGVNSCAGGSSCATGAQSLCWGTNSSAGWTNCFASGWNCVTNQICGHASGWNCVTNGACAHAEGQGSIANASASHAEGTGCVTGQGGAAATSAHAEGYQSVANGFASHAGGFAVNAVGLGEQALGFFSVISTGTGTISQAIGGPYEIHSQDAFDENNNLLVVGNGLNTMQRSNALVLDVWGNLYINDLILADSAFTGVPGFPPTDPNTGLPRPLPTPPAPNPDSLLARLAAIEQRLSNGGL